MATGSFPRTITGTLALVTLAASAQTAAAQGSDWPELRGPDRTGASPETGWSAVGKPEPLWSRGAWRRPLFVCRHGRKGLDHGP